MSAQPHFRSRTQRRDRDAELERLVAAELDACEAPPPLDPLIEPSAAERDFVDLVRQWLDRRPNKYQLMHLICAEVMSLDSAAPLPQPPPTPEQTSSVSGDSEPATSAEPDSHATP